MSIIVSDNYDSGFHQKVLIGCWRFSYCAIKAIKKETALSVIGSLPFIRFLYFYFSGNGGGHIQSLVFGGVLLIIGFITLMFGLIAELISFNRHLTEITLAKIKRIEQQLHSDTKSTALRSREKSR